MQKRKLWIALIVLGVMLALAMTGCAGNRNTPAEQPNETQTNEQTHAADQATEPEVTEPEVTEPEATEPEVTEPEVTEPEATEPEVTEPEVTEPEVTEPEVTEPEVTEPEVTEPEISETEPAEKKPLSNSELGELVERSTFTVDTYDSDGRKIGGGSGFFIDDKGTMVTCYHVIEGVSSISIKTKGLGSLDVEKVVAFNPVYDVAILQVDTTEETPYLKLCEDVDGVSTLDVVYAAGSPLSTEGTSLTPGNISYCNRSYGMIDFFQTTAPISNGNSGGPLVNQYGEVIGINAYSYTYGENMNLAIKVSMFDKLGEEVNYSMSQYASWYKKQVDRSYRVCSIEGEGDNETVSFTPSLINTYQIVNPEAECIASVDFNDELHDGYISEMMIYLYEYDPNEYDIYEAYLESQGFEYNRELSSEAGEKVYYFVNDWTGIVINLAIGTGDEHLYIFVYSQV